MDAPYLNAAGTSMLHRILYLPFLHKAEYYSYSLFARQVSVVVDASFVAMRVVSTWLQAGKLITTVYEWPLIITFHVRYDGYRPDGLIDIAFFFILTLFISFFTAFGNCGDGCLGYVSLFSWAPYQAECLQALASARSLQVLDLWTGAELVCSLLFAIRNDRDLPYSGSGGIHAPVNFWYLLPAAFALERFVSDSMDGVPVVEPIIGESFPIVDQVLWTLSEKVRILFIGAVWVMMIQNYTLYTIWFIHSYYMLRTHVFHPLHFVVLTRCILFCICSRWDSRGSHLTTDSSRRWWFWIDPIADWKLVVDKRIHNCRLIRKSSGLVLAVDSSRCLTPSVPFLRSERAMGYTTACWKGKSCPRRVNASSKKMRI